MSKYIDADELKSKIINTPTHALDEVELWTNDIVMPVIKRQREIFGMIDEMPTADVEPVKHGEWKCGEDFGGEYYECEACGRRLRPDLYKFDYCPRCGAKMQFMGGGEEC